MPLRFLGIKIYGQQNLKIQEQFIIVANHNSHLDTIEHLKNYIHA